MHKNENYKDEEIWEVQGLTKRFIPYARFTFVARERGKHVKFLRLKRDRHETAKGKSSFRRLNLFYNALQYRMS